jgi:hypothetical protein
MLRKNYDRKCSKKFLIVSLKGHVYKMNWLAVNSDSSLLKVKVPWNIEAYVPPQDREPFIAVSWYSFKPVRSQNFKHAATEYTMSIKASPFPVTIRVRRHVCPSLFVSYCNTALHKTNIIFDPNTYKRNQDFLLFRFLISVVFRRPRLNANLEKYP